MRGTWRPGGLTVTAAGEPVRCGRRTAWLHGAGTGAERLTAAADPVAVLAGLGDGWLACVHDEAADRLWLATDPLGARSLHYVRDAGGVVFGEDVVDVLEQVRRTPGPDGPAFSAWLAYGIVPAERSLYAGILRLPPGCALMVDGHGQRVHRYWSPRYREPLSDAPAVLAEQLRDEVDGAVGRHARGVARPGILLSGGFDSSTVAASLVHQGLRPHAFSAVFPNAPDADERALIERCAEELGLPCTLHSVTDGDPLAGDAAYIHRWRVPSTSPSGWIALPQLRQAAALGVDALFDGEGGDEVFGLDPYAVIADRFAAGHLLDAWRFTRRRPGSASANRRTRLRILSFYLRRDLPGRRSREALARVGAKGPVGVLRPAYARAAVAAYDQWRFLDEDGPRWWRWRKHAVGGLRHLLDAPGTLRRTAAMAGVATRHPLLVDSRLAAFALELPPELLFDVRFTRALARDAQVGRVPETIRTSMRKSTFGSVLFAALLGDRSSRLPDLFDEQTGHLREFCVPGRIAAWRGDLARGAVRPDADGLDQLWRLAVGELWLRSLATGKTST